MNQITSETAATKKRQMTMRQTGCKKTGGRLKYFYPIWCSIFARTKKKNWVLLRLSVSNCVGEKYYEQPSALPRNCRS